MDKHHIQIPKEILDYTGNHCMQLVIQNRSKDNTINDLQAKLKQSQEQNTKLVEALDKAQGIIDHYEEFVSTVGVK